MGNTKVIACFWGGPGSGKTSASLALAACFKTGGRDADLNREYAKNWVNEGRVIQPGDQNYIFAKQARTERMLMKENIEFIITDAPMAMSILYGRLYDPYDKTGEASKTSLKQHHEFCKTNGYKVEHYLIDRNGRPYDPRGRYQTADEAVGLDSTCVELMKEPGIKYTMVRNAGDVLKDLNHKGYISNDELADLTKKVVSQFVDETPKEESTPQFMYDSFDEYAETMNIEKGTPRYEAFQIIWDMARTPGVIIDQLARTASR